MSDVENLMAVLRGLHLAATMSLLGTAGFIAWLLPAVDGPPAMLRRRLHRLCRLSAGIAVLAGAAWFVLQTAAIAGADTWTAGLDALPVVAVHTHFGTIMLARLLLLLVATVLVCREAGHALYPTLALSALALGLQGFIGHTGAIVGPTGHGLVVSEALHLLAAGLWLGALLPLWFSVQALPYAPAAALCERFTPLGLACVLVLAGTGFAQGIVLVGSLPGLLGTPYGHFALLKITLFLLALGLALLNRLWLADRLAAGSMEARRRLMLSIVVETVVGLAVVAAAAFMASTMPATEATPIWPFAPGGDLQGMASDLASRGAAILGAALIGGAVLAVAGVVLWKRFLMLALLVLTSAVVVHDASSSPAQGQAADDRRAPACGFAAARDHADATDRMESRGRILRVGRRDISVFPRNPGIVFVLRAAARQRDARYIREPFFQIHPDRDQVRSPDP
jgi:putative copper export protein